MRPSRGTIAIVAIGVVGAITRIIYAVANANGTPAVDSDVYREIAHNVAHGVGYASVDSTGRLVDTAAHPPAFPLLIAGFDVVGLTTKTQQRVLLGVVAAVGVILTGFVARRIAGTAAGIVAAAIAAVHPLWLQHAGAGVSESLYLVAVPLVLLLGVRAIDSPTWQRMAALGAAIGFAALTRSEGVLFYLALLVPVALVAAHRWKDRAVALGVATVAVMLVLAPWVIRNYDTFGGLTLSTNRGVTLAGSWCKSTFSGEPGSWDLYRCVLPSYYDVVEQPPPADHDRWDELAIDRTLTDRAVTFARNHLDEVPKIVGLRIARTFGVYDLGNQLHFDDLEGRDRGLQQIGQFLNLLLLPLALFGAFVVQRRYLAVLLAGPIVTILTVATFYGSTRMRVPAEPAIAVLAAIAAVNIWQRFERRHTPGDDARTIERSEPTIVGATPD